MKWNEEEIEYLKNNYYYINNSSLTLVLSRTKSSIKSKARSLDIHKKSRKWTTCEITYLINNYSDLSNIDLSKTLNRTKVSVDVKASRLFLEKSIDYISNLQIDKNKKRTRDLSLNNLHDIAKLYKTKALFRLKDYSAYITAIKYGHLDDICKHMITTKYSTPQLICKYLLDYALGENCEYNTRKIIKPYELDIYCPKYKLAIEYNGKYWHGDEFNDNSNLKIRMCEKLDIKLIIIEERSRCYDIDIKADIVKLLPTLNKLTGTYIKESDIIDLEINNSIYDELFDDEYLTLICIKYKNVSEFKKHNSTLYNKLYRLNQLHRLTFSDN